MVRERKVTHDEIMDAAAQVILRDGASSLTTEAIAHEARVHKARLFYDQQTKSKLIEALFFRHLTGKRDHVQRFVSDIQGVANSEIIGRVNAMRGSQRDNDGAVMLALTASSSRNEPFQKAVSEWLDSELNAVENSAIRERSRIAFLALAGLFLLENFSPDRWSEAERNQILDEILSICTLS